jgi:hypothetical protein
MRFASCFPPFVGLVHSPASGRLFLIALPGLKISLHPSSEFTQFIPGSSISSNKRPFSVMDLISIIFQASVISVDPGKLVAKPGRSYG